MTEPLLEVTDLARRFGRKAALDGVSIRMERGEILGVLGPNGSGKTTLHRIVCTLLEPDAGSVRVDGCAAGAEIRRRLGVVMQEPSLDPILTAAENILFYGRLHGLSRVEARERLRSLAEVLHLESMLTRPTRRLSWGEKRRIELARGLLTRPPLLLLDEPGASLDPRARRELWHYLLHVNRSDGTGILVSTHNADEAALCHRIVVLREGRVAQEGEPASLLAGDLNTAFLDLLESG